MDECKRRDIGHYKGETYRPVADRFIEHYRTANNPTAESYKEKPFAKHNSSHLPQHMGEPKLKLDILARATCSCTTDMKITEARSILASKPDLNDRDEQIELRKFLV